MPEVTNLGYCPRCGIDLIEVPIGFVQHVKFCCICRDFLLDHPEVSAVYVKFADHIKAFQKECNQHPTTQDTEP